MKKALLALVVILLPYLKPFAQVQCTTDTAAYAAFLKLALYDDPASIDGKDPYELANLFIDYAAEHGLGEADTTGLYMVVPYLGLSVPDVINRLLEDGAVDEELSTYLRELNTAIEGMEESTSKEEFLAFLSQKRDEVEGASLSSENQDRARCIIDAIEKGAEVTNMDEEESIAQLNNGLVGQSFFAMVPNGPAAGEDISSLLTVTNVYAGARVPGTIIKKCGFFCWVSSVVVGAVVGVVTGITGGGPVGGAIAGGISFLIMKCCTWDACPSWDPQCPF